MWSSLQARRANKRKPKLPNLMDRGNAPAKLQFRDTSAETAFQGQPVKAGRVSQQAVKQLTDIFEVCCCAGTQTGSVLISRATENHLWFIYVRPMHTS